MGGFWNLMVGLNFVFRTVVFGTVAFRTVAFRTVAFGTVAFGLIPIAQAAPGIVTPDRIQYVSLAFKELPNYIGFLSRSPNFVSQLSPDEATMLASLSQVMMVRIWDRWDKPVLGDGPTYRYKLQFSRDTEAFRVPDSDKIRTARTTEVPDDPIVFNLNIINDPNVSFGFMDAIQLLVHEVGHKLGGYKKQAAVESLAAKMRSGLIPYVRQTTINSNLSITGLLIPDRPDGMGTWPDATPDQLLVDYKGRVLKAPLNLRYELSYFFTRTHDQELAKAGYFSGNFRSMTTLKFTDVSCTLKNDSAGTIDIGIQVEVEDRYAFRSPDVTAAGWLPTLGASAQMMIPQVSYTDLAPALTHRFIIHRSLSLGWLENWAGDAGSAQLNLGRMEHRHFSENLRDSSVESVTSNVERGKMVLRGSLQATVPIEEVHVLVPLFDEIPLLIPARITPKADGRYDFLAIFSFPTSSRIQSFSASALVINLRSVLLLPEVKTTKLPESLVPPATGVKPLEIWDEVQNHWTALSSDRTRERIQTSAVRLRTQITTQQKLRQITLHWVSGIELTLKDNIPLVRRFPSTVEVIPAALMKQEEVNGTLFVEFVSQIHKPTTPEYVNSRLEIRSNDSGDRALVGGTFIFENLEVLPFTSNLDLRDGTGFFCTRVLN